MESYSKFLHDIGRIKWRTERVVSYLQRAASFIILLASFKVLEWSIVFFVVGLVLAFVLLWIADKKVFYPGESRATLLENPEWGAIKAEIQDIKAEIQDIKELLRRLT